MCVVFFLEIHAIDAAAGEPEIQRIICDMEGMPAYARLVPNLGDIGAVGSGPVEAVIFHPVVHIAFPDREMIPVPQEPGNHRLQFADSMVFGIILRPVEGIDTVLFQHTVEPIRRHIQIVAQHIFHQDLFLRFGTVMPLHDGGPVCLIVKIPGILHSETV